ncbi:uncharacterized protein [Typha latifolia]|uniref:uncharacterized protein isoform X2 n=1 Tax=Typha latifolia TaxID=4733 RepID=UPI003C2F7564
MGRRGWKIPCLCVLGILLLLLTIRHPKASQKTTHLPSFPRRTLLSVTSGTPSNDMNMVFHPSKILAPSFLPPARILGFDILPSPDISPVLPHIKGRASSPTYLTKPQDGYAPSPITNSKGPVHYPPTGLAPSAEPSPSVQAVIPSMQPAAPPDRIKKKPARIVSPSVQSPVPSIPSWIGRDVSPSYMISPSARTGNRVPDSSHGEAPHSNPSVITPHTKVSPSLPLQPPATLPAVSVTAPPMTPFAQHSSNFQRRAFPPIPISSPINSDGVPAATSPNESPSHLLPVNNSKPRGDALSPTSDISPAIDRHKYGMPIAASPKKLHQALSPKENAHPKAPAISPTSNTSPAINGDRFGIPDAAPPDKHSSHLSPAYDSSFEGPSTPPTISPVIHVKTSNAPVAAPSSPKEMPSHLSPANSSHVTGSFPVVSPAPHKAQNPAEATRVPFSSPRLSPARTLRTPSPAPAVSFHRMKGGKGKRSPAYAPSDPSPLPSFSPASSQAPGVSPKNRQKRDALPPYVQGPSVSQAPSHSGNTKRVHSPSPSMLLPSTQNKRPILSPVLPPYGSASRKARAPSPKAILGLPPPPPNLDCMQLPCTDPLTNSLPGSTCTCVRPIKVGLRLSVALYTFFPLVSELAREIASGVLMKQSQVRIMGANSANEEPEKTIVLIDLVPLEKDFAPTMAILVYQKFWHKQVFINPLYFGDYDVLYVLYPGLPPSPPTPPGYLTGDDGAFGNNSSLHPFAAAVRKGKEKQSGIVVIILLSAIFALVLSVGAAWFILVNFRNHSKLPSPAPPLAKASGAAAVVSGSRPSSASASFNSSIATYTGTAKTFSLTEMERATNKFDDSKVIGEGGFGRVYEGILEHGKQVAIKVLKRDDRQGGREFLAEVEMLSRLHHRNLVKLLGICTEEHIRCLVYELVPNGSVESHLYGPDKETAPLDWDARLKIALGAARALAYLHEDSSPRVIHRDFKSSNILLEHDFTPKVSDFGLARSALGEGNEHISTRVMGTFGYVAPEYAMTGHLLVKSDVYSYGVVLLELLTGRKPVDMLRPPGQEILVTWARSFLTNKDDLEMIIDPSFGTAVPFDSVAKVAAIASMCVQPEVDQRPFMGEVVQALKLVCNEGNENKGSESGSREESHREDMEIRISTGLDGELGRVLSVSDMLSTSARFTRDVSGSFRRYSSSGPLRTGRGEQFWDRGRGLSTGSSSERGAEQRFETGFSGSG